MKSKIQKISDKVKGRRIQIPQPVLEMMELNAGDILVWNPDVKDGKITFYLTKDEEETDDTEND